MSYMIAEACSQQHEVLIVASPIGAAPADSILSRLPMNLSREPDEKPVSGAVGEPVSNGLKIAWQYGKYFGSGEWG